MVHTSSAREVEQVEPESSVAAAMPINENASDDASEDGSITEDESEAISQLPKFGREASMTEIPEHSSPDPLQGMLNREESLRGPLFRTSNSSASTTTTTNQSNKQSASLNPIDINMEQFHASWSNTDTDDLLGLSSSVGFPAVAHRSAALVVERPSSLSRSGSVALRATSIGSGSGHEEKSDVSSAIHDAARITNWKTVKDLCEENPEAARYIGRDRWTALHHACNRRCPHADVVEALIKAYPDALLQDEDKGWLPLHYACRFKCKNDVVRLLLHMYPDKGRTAVTKLDRQGRTPLWYAVRYDAPPGVVGLLLEVDPQAVLEEDERADSPLALVWDTWAEKLEGMRSLQRIHMPSSEAESMSLEEQAKVVMRRLKGQSRVFERWTKVNIFLQAAFGLPFDEDAKDSDLLSKETKDPTDSEPTRERNWRILHATSAIKCHPKLFLLACALHPEQAFEFDEQDLKVPAHICGGCNEGSNVTALHFAAASKANGETARIIINRLLTLNPDAAMAADSTGCLPLHRIAENKEKRYWTLDGFAELYTAHTRGLFAVDHNGRLPLHCAANAIAHRGAVEDEAAASESIICRLLEANGDAASHPDNLGYLPLHVLARHGETWDFQVQAVCDAFRNAVRSRAGVKAGNQLPLHLAALNPKAHSSLTKHLVSLHPRGASQADRRGKLPLHLACEVGLSWGAIEPIYNAFPAAVQQPEGNARGWNVLHLASKSIGADADLFSNLITACGQAAAVPDTRGRYPLHLACLSGKGWQDGVSLLFDACPGAIRSPDDVGLLPFHIACFRYCAASTDGISRSSSHDGNERRFSKAHEDSEKEMLKEAEDTKDIDLLFNLLRADPTILH